VNRVASSLQDPAHLNTLYCLLFTMPGIPSIYYGSEWGIQGKKADGDDSPLRPRLDLAALSQNNSPLPELIADLSRIRSASQALRHGDYRQLSVNHEGLAFARQTGDECVIVLVNASGQPATLEFSLPVHGNGKLEDLLNKGEFFSYQDGYCKGAEVPAHWARILRVR
jgi:cyclomaltodextrinase